MPNSLTALTKRDWSSVSGSISTIISAHIRRSAWSKNGGKFTGT